MSDLRTLNDAFAELERRADAATAAAGTAPVVRPRRAVRLVPMAATVVAVAGLVAGAVWLVPGGSGTPAAGPPTTSSTALATTTARSPIPNAPDELIARFKVVLGDTATFEATMKFVNPGVATSKNPGPSLTTVDQTPNATSTALIAGTLTSAGVTGSFNLSIFPTHPGPGIWCGTSRTKGRVVSMLPGGSRLETATTRPDRGAVSYLACLERPDGTRFEMNVGNQEDPMGAGLNTPGGKILAPQPPLTLDQVKAIVTSDKW